MHTRVRSVDSVHKKLTLENGSERDFDILIIATGSVTQKFEWPGQDLKGVQGLYSFQDLESMTALTQGISNAVVAGGGLIGVELAEMMHAKKIAVTLLVRDQYYWGSVLPQQDGELLGRHIASYGLDLRFNSQIKEIIGDGNGNVKQVLTNNGEIIDCQFVGIATGVKPNIAFLVNSGIELGKGVLVNSYFETNIKDIYAIGDCAEFRDPVEGRKKLEQVWYTGRMHGETLAQTICGKRSPYRPGPWFNSAKFFDIEYQTYGQVPARASENETYFFWQHPKKNIALGILFDSRNGRFIGLNAYGIRLRHSIFDDWITRQQPVDYVLNNLNKAMFNPEFAKDYSKTILLAFKESTGRPVSNTRSKKIFFNFNS